MNNTRRVWLVGALLLVSGLVVLTAMQIDLVSVLRNPIVLLGGLVLVGVHVAGGALVATLAFLARKRWPRH